MMHDRGSRSGQAVPLKSFQRSYLGPGPHEPNCACTKMGGALEHFVEVISIGVMAGLALAIRALFCGCRRRRGCGGSEVGELSLGTTPMRRNSTGYKPMWRALVGCVLAYALVLNALLSGVLAAEWAAKAAAGLIDQHCLTETGVAPVSSDQAPADHHDESSHCVFCTIAVASAVLLADLSSATIVQYRAAVPAGVSDRDRPYLPVYPSRLPRGPPERS